MIGFWILIFQISLTCQPEKIWNYPLHSGPEQANIRTIQKNLSSFSVIRGYFEQKKIIHFLKNSIDSYGQFTFSSQHGVDWRIAKPFQQRFHIHSRGITEIDNENNLLPFQQHIGQMWMSFFTLDIETLTRFFHIYWHTDKSTWCLGLRPKTKILIKIFDNIVISGKEFVTKIEIKEIAGHRTLLSINRVSTQPSELTTDEKHFFTIHH